MSVLIKGMEMPKDCATCLMCDKGDDGMWYCVATMTNLSDKLGDMLFFRPDWCPLVEVPTPHGRLIDGDALHKSAVERTEKKGNYYNMMQYVISPFMIDLAPTIIEAED